MLRTGGGVLAAGLEDWVTLGGISPEEWVSLGGDPKERAAGVAWVHEAIEAATASGPDADDRLATALEAVLESGLALRDGMMLAVGDWQYGMYSQLRFRFGADLTKRLVCESCLLVFTTSGRKWFAKKCDWCRAANKQTLVPGERREDPAGRGHSIGTLGDPIHNRVCTYCWLPFSAATRATVFCSDECGSASRAGRTHPGHDPEAIELKCATLAHDQAVVGLALLDAWEPGMRALRGARVNPATRIDGRARIAERFDRQAKPRPRGVAEPLFPRIPTGASDSVPLPGPSLTLEDLEAAQARQQLKPAGPVAFIALELNGGSAAKNAADAALHDEMLAFIRGLGRA